MTVASTPATREGAPAHLSSRRADIAAPRAAFKQNLAAIAKRNEHLRPTEPDTQRADFSSTEAIDETRWDQTRPAEASAFSEAGLLEATLVVDIPDTHLSSVTSQDNGPPRPYDDPSPSGGSTIAADPGTPESSLPAAAQIPAPDEPPQLQQQRTRPASTAPAIGQDAFAPPGTSHRADPTARPQPRARALHLDPRQKIAEAPVHLALTGDAANIAVVAAIDRADREDRERLRDRIAAELSRHGHDAAAVRVAGLPLTHRADRARKEP